MKLTQLFQLRIVMTALLVAALGWGAGQNFLSASNWNLSWQETRNSPSQGSPDNTDNDSKPRPDNSPRAESTASPESTVQPENRTSSDAISAGPGNSAEPGDQPVPLRPENHEVSRELLQNSLYLLRTRSLKASLRQRGVLFETELVASGNYLHADGGKGGVRTELEIQTRHLHWNVLMVNDGVYYFRQIQSADTPAPSLSDLRQPDAPATPRVERIHLRQIREKYSDAEVWSGHWIAFGGLYLFMDQVRRSFDWTAPREQQIRGQTCHVISGTWKPEKLASLVPEQRDAILERRALDWQRIPPQIPLQIELYLVKEGDLAGFPLRIIFYRPDAELLEGIRNRPVLITEFSDTTLIDTPPQTDFQFNAAENEVIDKTEDFLISLRK